MTRHDFHVVREGEKEGEGVDLKGCLPWDEEGPETKRQTEEGSCRGCGGKGCY